MLNSKTDGNAKTYTQRYPKEIKDTVVGAIINGELFLEEAMRKYGVEDRHSVISWLRKYVRNEKQEDGSKARRRKELKSTKDLPGFDRLVSLAMEENSLFFEKFEEVFPHFCKTLKLRYPTIMLSELKFFAYLRLGFSSKEIAVATSVTPGAVDRRKIRVRRKFDIPLRVKICEWVTSVTGD